MYEQLLAVQELDTTADQIRHRREALPERAELRARQAELADLGRRTTEIGDRRHELDRSQRKLEDDIAMLAEKAKQVDRTMYSGTVSAPRELLAMQEEVESLHRRQSALEDEALEIMETAEPLDDELAAMGDERAAIDRAIEALMVAIAEAEVSLDAELADVERRRAEAVEGVPADLVAEYDRLRKALGGVGVARLVGANCSGCHLTLAAVELDRIRHNPDAIHHCDECGRLLVVVGSSSGASGASGDSGAAPAPAPAPSD